MQLIQMKSKHLIAGPRSAVGSASDSRARGHGFDTRSGHILSFLLPLIPGWSGGAMVLGKLPVPGRPTYLE